MQSQQHYRGDSEGRTQDSSPAFPPPVSRPEMAGRPYPPYPYQEQPPIVVQNF